MRMLVLGAFATFLASVQASAAQAAAPLMQPTEKWVVNFDDAQCLASRNYGTAQQPVLLGLKAPPLGDIVQLMIVRPGSPGASAGQFNATIAADGLRPFNASMLEFTAAGTGQQVFQVNLPLRQFAAVRAAQTLSIKGAGLDLTLALDDMQPLMTVMDDCVADLRNAWNVGPNPRLRQPPRTAEPVSFAPLNGPGPEAEGSVEMALLIDETGKIADCTVIQTSGIAMLDAQSCGIYESSARFRPAIGLDGRPAKGSYVQQVDWGA
jgi:hypothetical protein